jgi:hypothetical protein
MGKPSFQGSALREHVRSVMKQSLVIGRDQNPAFSKVKKKAG